MFIEIPNHNEQSTIYAGRYWAAINNNEVVSLVAMNNPLNGNFEEYREKAIAFLTLLGTPKAGVIEVREGKRFFLQRLTHVNRGKYPRQPKVFPVYENCSELNGDANSLGYYWGALRGKSVMAIVAAVPPAGVDKVQFEISAKACLALQGTILSGQLVEENGTHFLITESLLKNSQTQYEKYVVVKPRKNFITSPAIKKAS